MGTTNLTLDQAVPGWQDVDNIFCIKNTIDLAAVATGEVLQALLIPAGTLVLGVMTKVVTPSNSTTTATIGDGDGATSWDASVNLTAAAGTVAATVFGTDAYGTTGKLYAAEDTIDATVTISTSPATVGSFDIQAICVKI